MSAAIAAMDLTAGAIFARDFKIVDLLAEGGMGVIYTVEQVSTSRLRALKIMHPQLVQNAKHRERFAAEAKVSSRIESDHVTEIVGAGVDEVTGIAWLAMELLRGRTLHSMIERSGPLAPADALEVSNQLAHVLWQAHGIGLVHRDLKPENIYMAVPRRGDVSFTVKVLDFGIAKWVQEARNANQNSQVIGSPFWMAPEQLEHGGLISPATDVWALGLIFFFVLTGRMYWNAANLPMPSFNGLMLEVVVHPIAPASARAAELGVAEYLPREFDAWFARSMERDISKRYPSSAECLTELRQLLLAASRLPSKQGAPVVLSTGSGNALEGLEKSGVAPISGGPGNPVPRSAPRSSGAGGDLGEVLDRHLAATDDPALKGEIALRIARVFELQPGERERAIDTYKRSLQYVPGSIEALRGLSAVYRSAERWGPLVEVLRAQELLPTGSLGSGDVRTLRLEIACVLEERLSDPPSAERAWRAAFEANPLDIDVSKGLVAHLGRRQLWGEAAGVLERVVDAISTSASPMPDREFDTLQSLGTLYRDRLHQPGVAVRYFERAARVRPEDHTGHFALAEIYAQAGRMDEAASHWMRLVTADPSKPEPYNALFEVHKKLGATDRMWCTAAVAVAVFGDATPAELREVYERGRARAAATPQGRIPDDLWEAHVRHPAEARVLTPILEIAAVALRRAIVKSPTAAGLLERERVDPALSSPGLVRASMPIYRAMLAASATLDVPTVPVLYYRAAQTSALTHVAAEPMASLAGGEFLKSASSSTLGFLAARHITYYRPEYYVRVLAPETNELVVLLQSALDAVADGASAHPLVRAEPGRVAFEGPLLERLRAAVTAPVVATNAELAKWSRAVDSTAVRAAAVLCGDPSVLRAALWGDASIASTTPAEQVLADAVPFVLSEGYASMRTALGMVRK